MSLFCPLDLVDGTEERRWSLAQRLVDQATTRHQGNGAALRRLAIELGNTKSTLSKLLRRLESLQRELDPHGVLSDRTDPTSQAFLTAMTLRDCTLFIDVPAEDAKAVEARIADLDLKSPDAGKLEYWRVLERRLVEEGWYRHGERQPRQLNHCLLACSE